MYDSAPNAVDKHSEPWVCLRMEDCVNRVVADCTATPDKKSKVQTGRVMLHLREQIGCVTCSLLTDC